MPKVSKKSAKRTDHGPVINCEGDAGEYKVNFTTFRNDLDHSPFLKGLPDDRCQCAHFGYVLKGKMTMRYADHDEVYEEGDAFYAPPGHVPITNLPETEVLMISPAADLKKTDEAIMRNMAAMKQS